MYKTTSLKTFLSRKKKNTDHESYNSGFGFDLMNLTRSVASFFGFKNQVNVHRKKKKKERHMVQKHFHFRSRDYVTKI